METVVVTLVTSFVGGAIGGMLGVWLAWKRIQKEVMMRLGDRVLADLGGRPYRDFQVGPKGYPDRE